MISDIKRVLNFAFVDFYRNRGISIAAIFVLIITTLLVTGIFFVQGISNYLLLTIQNKIDVTAYFKEDAPEQDILKIKEEIVKMLPDIKNVEYVSKQEALENFTQRHIDNRVLSKALTEVGDNPFLASLNIITTGKAAQYEQVSNILENEKYSPLIEKVDFSQKKNTIEKIFSITSRINNFGIGLALVLIFIVILVVFNTIKLVIDHSREEISTMKIIGAGNWLIRSPFIVQGAIFGIVSFVFCFLITTILAYFLSPGITAVIPGFSLLKYFIYNIWIIVLIQLGSGIGLGVVSSFMVVRRYLKD